MLRLRAQRALDKDLADLITPPGRPAETPQYRVPVGVSQSLTADTSLISELDAVQLQDT